MLRNYIKNLIIQAVHKAIGDKRLPVLNLSKGAEGDFWESVTVEHPENKEFGDWASNAALKLAKIMKKSSMEIAEVIVGEINGGKKALKYFDKAQAVKPGFINFYLSKKYLQKSVLGILSARGGSPPVGGPARGLAPKGGKQNKFGDSKIGKNKKIQIEFISANPTGPLTLGNGRGGFMGDVLRNVMKVAGYRVDAEYFINDSKHSNQVRELGKTVLGKGDMYKSDYLKYAVKGLGRGLDIENAGYRVAHIISNDHKKIIEGKFKIKFDSWFSEQALFDKNEVKKILDRLDKLGFVYKKDSAIWLKTSERGDNEDRVLVRADGEPTYFTSDIAYHVNKFKRGYKKIINFWGADHHGHIKRLKIGMEMLGYDSSGIEVVIMQLVRLIKDGMEVKMSKRKGQYVTLEELVDGVGLDVARFFFLMVSANRHMDFDLGLAKEKSEKNPVYYVQYAGARIRSIIKKSKIFAKGGKNLKLLDHRAELGLMRKLMELPEIIEDTAEDYQVQRLPNYSIEVARAFHNFYDKCQVISGDKNLTRARLALISATQIVLKKVLDLMGVSAPDKM